MGKIIASYLLKVHVHDDPEDGQEAVEAPTLDQVKQAVVDGIGANLGFPEVTISLAERTDD